MCLLQLLTGLMHEMNIPTKDWKMFPLLDWDSGTLKISLKGISSGLRSALGIRFTNSGFRWEGQHAFLTIDLMSISERTLIQG
jgi:hypothetical protein